MEKINDEMMKKNYVPERFKTKQEHIYAPQKEEKKMG
jgi:hypothetical protein